jgi:hypothetical protein
MASGIARGENHTSVYLVKPLKNKGKSTKKDDRKGQRKKPALVISVKDLMASADPFDGQRPGR